MNAYENAVSVVEKLKANGMTIAFAESCTGGLAAAKLIDVPAASSVLGVSFVTYASEAKVEYLGVSESTIECYNVVSEEVAREMALGVARRASSNVGVGITGLAGPTGGDEIRPVGTVCFGIAVNGEVTTFKMCFGNIGRNEVRAASVEFIFEKLNELL